MVVNGQADKSLLATYDTERLPVGRRVVNRAWKSVQGMSVVPKALGFHLG